MKRLSPELATAYGDYEREMNIRKSRLGCLISIVLFPAFNLLDLYVYPAHQKEFLYLRIFCSVLMAGLYPLFGTQVGRQFHRSHGLVLLALPTTIIAYMVHATEGAMSSYYAGLTFVMLVLAVVLDWTFLQSVAAIFFVVLLYLLACYSSFATIDFDFGVFFNNLAFLISTGAIIVIGTYFHSTLRRSEFVSRYELDQSRRTLAGQNLVLEDTLKQLKETELQLVQTEKIVSLGRLSAGIIHEINNPLNFATTGLYVLRNQGQKLAAEKPEEFQDVLQDVEEGVQRVKNIISELRTFTHPDASQQDVVKISEVVTSSLRFLSNEWRDKVQIDQAVPESLECLGNKNKLIQVFVNLLQNALDALKNKPDGAEPPAVRVAGRCEAGKVFITVRDNGEGVEPQNLARIFDPFFTTREVGKGMGMGLSICYRIVQEMNGLISVQSERGKFCQFTIELPGAAPVSIAA